MLYYWPARIQVYTESLTLYIIVNPERFVSCSFLSLQISKKIRLWKNQME